MEHDDHFSISYNKYFSLSLFHFLLPFLRSQTNEIHDKKAELPSVLTQAKDQCRSRRVPHRENG